MMMKITKTTQILFIALVVVVIYANSLKSDFAWDDTFLIVENPYIKNWQSLDVVFSEHVYYGANKTSNYYRPLQLVSYIVDYSLWKLNPAGYHLTNLCLHAISSILVYIFIIAVFGSSGIAFLTALLFASAPVISSATYFIASRADLLAAFFILLSILAFIKYYRQKKRLPYVASLACFILALLSRESAIVLPFLVALVFFKISSKRNFKELFRETYLFFILLIVYILARVTILNFVDGETGPAMTTYVAGIPFLNRMLTNFKVLAIYLRLLVLPFGLHMKRVIEPASSVFQPDILLSIGLIAIAGIMVKRLSRKYPSILFGLAWFFIALFPLLNVYPLSVFLHEAWLYLPSIGFYLLLSTVLLKTAYKKLGRFITGGIIATLLVYFISFSMLHGVVWRDSITIFQNTIRYDPSDPNVHANLALAYFDKGEEEEAIRQCRYSVSLNPKFSGGHNNLGFFYAERGEYIKAIKNFKSSIKANPENAAPYLNISLAYNKLGYYDKALDAITKCIELSPDYYKPYCTLGLVCFNLNNYQGAERAFKKARSLNKNSYEAHYYLGTLYLENGDTDSALKEYEICMRLDERDAEFYNNLAGLYIKTGEAAKAEKAFMQAKVMDDSYIASYNNLGNLYSALGMFDLAIVEYEKALSLEPDNPEIRSNLAKTYKDLDKASKSK